jgi:hypothetical protein
MDMERRAAASSGAEAQVAQAHGESSRRGAQFASSAAPNASEHRVRTALLLVLIATAFNGASAQRESLLKVGARVRINTPDAQIIGKVAEIRGDTIVVDRGPAESAMAISLSNATDVAVYARGRSSETAMLVLGTLGAATGAALYVSWCVRDPEWCRTAEPVDHDPYDDEIPPSTFATITIGFAAIGLLLGHSFAPPQWTIIDPAIRVGLTPTSTGIAAFISIPAPRFTRRPR